MILRTNLEATLFAILVCYVAEYAATDEYCEGPSSERWYKFEGNCYLFNLNSEHRQSYYDAEDYCRSKGAHLVSIQSEKENHFIMNTLSTRNRRSRIWIGLNSLEAPNRLQWSDESVVSYTDIMPKTQYQKESCFIIFLEKGRWRSEHCALHYTSICKRAAGDVTPTPIQPMTTPAIQGNCPQDWIQFGQKCYKYFGAETEERKTFKDAKAACVGLGENHDLASVHSMEEQAFLGQTLAELKHKVSSWIGFRYVESDEIGHDMVFGWTDNSRTDFTFWAPGHPPRGTWKYCARLNIEGNGAGEWIADYCDHTKYGFICQGFPNTSISIPSPMPSTCDQNSVGYGESCYRYFPEPQNWDQAEKTCQDKEGHLVSISDRFEEFFLHNFLKHVSTPVWIGLTTIQGTRIVRWSDNQAVYYANWARNQPLIVDLQSPSCVSISKADAMQWNITNCASQQPFVCEFTKVPAKPQPPDVIGSCPATESTWIDIGDNYCYHISQESFTWDEGSRYCISKGMEMISLHSEHQMRKLLSYMWNSRYNLWLGLIQAFDKESFLWVDGSILDYTNWEDGEPSAWSRNYKKHCVSVSMRNSKWYPTECKDWNQNICRARKRIHVKSVRSIPSERMFAEALASASRLTDRGGYSNGSEEDAGIILTSLIACIGLSVLLMASVFYYMRKKQSEESQDFLSLQRIENTTPESEIGMEETLPKY